MNRYQIIVRGNVQGVGFRYHTLRTAALFGICGQVRNRPDGSVEIDAEGNDDAFNEFYDAIKKGSVHSVVRSLDVKKMTGLKNYSSFRIE